MTLVFPQYFGVTVTALCDRESSTQLCGSSSRCRSISGDHGRQDKTCCQVEWTGSFSSRVGSLGALLYFLDPKAQAVVAGLCFQLVGISKRSPNAGHQLSWCLAPADPELGEALATLAPSRLTCFGMCFPPNLVLCPLNPICLPPLKTSSALLAQNGTLSWLYPSLFFHKLSPVVKDFRKGEGRPMCPGSRVSKSHI